MADLLFRILDDGREYKIYPNGKIEGFGPNAIVFNYFPQLAAGVRERPHGQPVAPCHPQTLAADTGRR
jgi:hypothetical protein